MIGITRDVMDKSFLSIILAVASLIFVWVVVKEKRDVLPSNHQPDASVSQRPETSAKPRAFMSQGKEELDKSHEIVDSLTKKDAHKLAGITAMLIKENSSNLPQLRELITSPEGEVREYTGGILAQIGSADAVELLIESIKNEQDSLVHENLIELLRGVTNSAAVPTLAKYAQDMSDLAMHRVCRNVVSSMDDPAAIAQLIALLETGEKGAAMEPISYAIAHSANEKSVPVLITGASSENESVARSSIEGLGNVGTPSSFKALFDIIASNGGSLRGQIAQAVAVQTALRVKGTGLIAVCEDVLDHRLGVEVSKIAIDSLVAIPSAESLAALEKRVAKGTEPAVSTYAQEAISRHKTLWPSPARRD